MRRKILNALAVILFFSFSLSAQTELQLARQYYEQEEYEKALDYLDELEKKFSTKAFYDLRLNCYLALGDFKEAEDLIEKAIKYSRGNQFEYYADLTYVYLEQDKQNKADDLVEDVLERVRRNGGLAYGFSNAFQQRGYPRIALEIYETAEQNMSTSGFAYQKALLYGELGDIKKMYATYVDMVVRQPSYLSTVKQLLGRALQEEESTENSDYLKELIITKIQEDGPETLNDLLVFIFIKEKNFSGAFTQLKALDRRNPSNKAELFQLGRVAMNNEDYILARRVFDYIIDAGPDFPFYEQALVYDLKSEKQRLRSKDQTETEQWQDLRKDYYQVLEELKGQPEVGELTVELADISAFQMEEVDTAEAMLRKLISTGFVGPEDQARAKIKLGDILLYKGERWDAIIFYTQAEKAFEQSPIGQEAKFKRAKAAYYVGDFQWAQGIFDALKASTSKLIANDALYYSILINDNIALDTNTEAMAMFARADLMNYQNKTDSALTVLNMMDIAFPGHSIRDEVFFLKSKILTKKKRYEEAAESLSTLIANHADDILADDAYYALAQLYEHHLGKQQEAMDIYQKIFTEHPDSFYASDARKRFREMRGDILN